jgi:hypothetical protein
MRTTESIYNNTSMNYPATPEGYFTILDLNNLLENIRQQATYDRPYHKYDHFYVNTKDGCS